MAITAALGIAATAVGITIATTVLTLTLSVPPASSSVPAPAPAASGGPPVPMPPARVDSGPPPARSQLQADSRGASEVPTASWGWPLEGVPRVVRGFEPPPERWLPGHRGVDLSANPGDHVLAAGAGTVTWAGPLAGRGVIVVSHGALRTTYEPVEASVRVGDTVRTGQRLGVLTTGASHCGGYPPCLHWGLLKGETYLDPLTLLGVSHPVLLPVPS